MKSKTDILKEGSRLLEPIMTRNGFSFSIERERASSGGNFAYGSWIKNDRKIEYHYRDSLGLVTYSLATKTIAHEFLLWSFTGEKRKANYPGSSDDPMDGFRRLLDDLSDFCAIFLNGSDLELSNAIHKAEELEAYWESLSPFKRMEIQ